MWANPNNMATPTSPFTAFPPGYATAQAPVPLVPHLHGSEVQSYFDGGPEAWFTYNGIKGPTYNTKIGTDTNAAVYYYNNAQEPTTLWYHDHALGMTRLNVMSGLAGYYILRDPTDPTDAYLSTHFQYGVSEIPIAIQDRSFYANGELWFPTVGVNPTIHPYWMPEFFGNTIMVNGLVWPNLNVNQGWYRFRLLDGSNARFYTLSFSNKMPFMVIGTEGGYLQQSAPVTSITIAPGERADVLVDFSAVPAGTKIVLQNTAKAPFPNGAAADPQTVGQIMQFTVVGTPGVAAPVLPTPLNPTLPVGVFPIASLGTPTTTRYLALVEVMGPAGPTMVLINGQGFADPVTETPTEGTTEDWVIINLTADTHPIHTHLATFQLFSRQRFQAAKYMKDWLALNALKIPATGMLPFTSAPTPLPPTSYLQGKATPALPNEMGWKDTVQMNPGEVTTIRIRFTQQDGTPYPFDPKLGPGYVWHCHIVDHEDNEMMRPYIVT
jgi:FtsP/CotA-like multicopper oxidase with cupredoxin domain